MEIVSCSIRPPTQIVIKFSITILNLIPAVKLAPFVGHHEELYSHHMFHNIAFEII
jgi:hypothetical protein